MYHGWFQYLVIINKFIISFKYVGVCVGRCFILTGTNMKIFIWFVSCSIMTSKVIVDFHTPIMKSFHCFVILKAGYVLDFTYSNGNTWTSHFYLEVTNDI